MAKVLLAADPTLTRTRGPLRPCLEGAGHEVSEVGDGLAVLDALRTAAPEVLVLDTALPSLDGFQVLQRLRRDGDAGRIPIVILSGVAPALARQIVDRLGAVAYLPKPVTCQALCDAVDRALGLRLTLLPRAPKPTPHPAALAAPAENEDRASRRAPAG
jgi:CheY-like chemotaxis protein